MKKQLLATTALVAASLMVTGDALAQASPIMMGVKGYWREFIQVQSSPSNDNMVLAAQNPSGAGPTTYTGTTGTANTRGHVRSFNNDLESRTFFVGEGKLDNGITPGVNIQFETFNRNSSLASGGSSRGTAGVTNCTGTAAGSCSVNGFLGNQERRAKGYFKGAFGELAMGNTDNIGRLNATYEAVIDVLGADSPSGEYPLGSNNTFPDLASGATRIMYLSPKFAGFDFGISYAPDATSDVYNGGPGAYNFTQDGITTNRFNGAYSQNYTPLIRYNGPIGPTTVGADISYTGSSNECSGRVTPGIANFSAGCVGHDANVSTTAAHGFVSWAGFKLGLGYAKWKAFDGNGLNRTVWSPGLDYTTGPWTFGLYYSTGDYDGNRAPLSATGAALGPAVKSTDTLQMLTPAVMYTLGPGIKLESTVAIQRYKYGVNAAYRNAGDFGFSSVGTQNAATFSLGATFSY